MKPRMIPVLLTLCGLAGSAGLLGCASRSGSAQSPSGSPLLGHWVARPAGAPCDFEIELLQNGSARSNYLNDDSSQHLCAMHSLSFSVGTPQRDSLDFWLGSQAVRYCFYQLSGSSLSLVCDEHRPPDRATPPLQFSRAVAPLASTTGSVVGMWRGGGFTLEFTQDGRFVSGGGSGVAYRIVSRNELELLFPQPERCSYELRGDNELLLGCTSMGGSAHPLILRR